MGALLYAVLLAAYVVFGGPTAPIAEETVVVLPGEHGHIGGVVVRRGLHVQVLDTAYAASHIGTDGVLDAERLSAAEVQQEYGKTIAALPPKPASFMLYFITGTDELTEESKVELQRVMAEIRKRPVADVELIGHTDTVGAKLANDLLSKQRAETMRKFLLDAGISMDRIEVSGRGEREPLVPTGNEVDEPRNRRVEINVR
ncbi:MAG TPA: OmpA family protein [Burkholderiales bacterium]|nr:OmpA family protein [Burkholderiales bacterium]